MKENKMKNVYKSIVIAAVFGNVIALPVVAYTFPWDTYLIDPTPYYIVQSGSLGFLIAVCIFIYEWAKYGDKPWLSTIKKKTRVKK
jgi:protein-S-isoprenylcysteine O-methyltransferase Ste14